MPRPLTIEEIIDELNSCKSDAKVRFDFPPYQFPTKVASWRGSYDTPALGHAGEDSHNQSSVNMREKPEEPTVADLVAELEKATDGRRYEGWKGGYYSYSTDQKLYVDNPGEYNRTVICGVIDDSYQVILQTMYYDKFF